MAHEIAHVAARHGTRQPPVASFIAQLATIPLIFMGGAAAYGIYEASFWHSHSDGYAEVLAHI